MHNISLIGMAGCGKSTLGNAISEKYNLSFVDTDKLIEAGWQMTLEEIKRKHGYETLQFKSNTNKPNENLPSVMEVCGFLP